MAKHLSGPGILSVRSKIVRPNILDEDTYLRWYDGEHVPELMRTSGIQSGWRYRDTTPDSDRYWLFYTLKDIAFLQSDEFFSTKHTSDKLPGSGHVFDLADFESHFYSLIQVYDPTGKGPGHTKTILFAAFELVGDQTAEDLDRWYRDEHLARLAQTEGFLRTTRYKFAGSPPPITTDNSTAATAVPEPRTWLALHEYEVDNIDLGKLSEVTMTEWTEKMLTKGTKSKIAVCKLVKSFGENNLFYGVNVEKAAGLFN